MTGGTVFFNRTGAIGLVAAGALLVKRISALGDFFITFSRVMAFHTRLGLVILIFGKGVVAVTARDSVSVYRLVGLVIEQYLARRRCI